MKKIAKREMEKKGVREEEERKWKGEAKFRGEG